jgi:threonine/homoserine/homoserine lactone efflux protein
MLENLITMLLVAVALMGSPGPATLSLAAVGAAFGAKAGLRFFAGIISGNITVLLLLASGVTGIVLAAPEVKIAITVAAGAYILYLAYRIATAPPAALAGQPGVRAPSFPSAYLIAIANPKAYAALGAVYSGNTLITRGFGDDTVLIDSGAKLLVMIGVMITVNGSWLIFGSAFAAVLTDPEKSRIANICFALLLVVSVVLAVI